MAETDIRQFTSQELMDKMKSILPPSIQMYSKRYFLQKLQQEFGNDIVITQSKNLDFICFKGVLNKGLKEKMANQSEEDVLSAAAQILERDIRSHVFCIDEYPSFEEIANGGVNIMPQKLQVFMNKLSSMNKKSSDDQKIKCIAIQNAIVSLVRPRFVSPVLIGIGTLIHRRTCSRFLVDTLNAYGFCSSYQDIMKMQKLAAATPQRKKLESAYIQHSWDNADINIRTLTGHQTWHSMGGLECITPHSSAIVTGNLKRDTQALPAKELGKFGSLPLKTYIQPNTNGLRLLKVTSIDISLLEKNVNVRKYVSTECLWLCGRLFGFDFAPSWLGYNSHITSEISGFVQTKTVPLPFINLDPGNLSTIFTALSFTASQSKELNQEICFATFDQPIYIKAVTMVKSAPPSSEISKVVVRLGGFHLLMSFLGTIGYVMNGSGIEELLSTVYASNSIVHILSGHSYSRSIRAFFLVQEAITHLALQHELQFSDKDISYLQNVFNSFDASTSEEVEDPLLKKIEYKLNEQFNKFKSKSRTARLWVQFWQMVDIVKNFIKAERSGDWSMHLLCVAKMIPYFYATGKV